ncbi:MAG: hypothetical protein KKA12_09460, partial [Alphaproteobacteria bacterium]|nr:hypothetical protein [Alphaproteobacteria bacterium]
MFRGRRSLFRDEAGVVGPAYAVGILVLVAIAGVGFDYGRMVSLDSELQNAADQAALAGATQLDGKSGACDRARSAVADPVNRFVVNHSRLANDGQASPINFQATPGTGCGAAGSIRFYKDKNKVVATTDADAHFVEVLVDARAVNYALTPLVGAFSSGLMNAAAMAGLGSSVCKVPPVFMCNPFEPTSPSGGNPNTDFDADALRGAGLVLLSGSPNTPGNFGFLDLTGLGNPNAAGTVSKAIGWDSLPIDCSRTDGTTGLTPGQKDVIFGAFNTRFDVVDNGANVCPSGGTCSAATITRKDLVQKSNGCRLGNNGWQEPPVPYLPSAANRYYPIGGAYPSTMGYPRDICHAVSSAGDCAGGIVGDKAWDRDAFFHVNFSGWSHNQWLTNTGLTAQATRYEVYQWEKSRLQAGNPPAAQPLAGNLT